MKKVVIIGAGYSGIYALRELVKNKNIKITLLDKHTYHNLQPEIYDFIANKANIANVTIDLTLLCAGLQHPFLEYKNLRATDIDFKLKKISTAESETIPYDYIVLSAGARTFFPPNIDGLVKTNDLKKLNRALFFKQSFETQLYMGIKDSAKKCNDTHIAVIGAGLSGVEIAAEMAYNASNFFKKGRFACDNLKISLISSSDTILPGFHPSVIRMSHKRLKALKIDVITSTKMQSCDDKYLYLSNGTKIMHSFILYAGGVEAANISSSLGIKKNKRGQVEVNSYLQSQEHDNIFVAGDIAVIKNTKQEIMPQNVTTARSSGISAGKNILRAIQDKKLVKCNPKVEGVLIALGGKYAVCDIYGIIKVKGIIGFLIKKYVFLIYKLPLLKYIKKGYSLTHS